MASAALSRPQTVVLPVTEACPPNGVRAGELCDELLAHMLECNLCLDPEQHSCPACLNLQSEIKAQGGAGTGVVFAF
jgi:hypothetical protein